MLANQSKKYVIDANVLFSAFISGKNVYDILFSTYKIFVPDFAFLELEKYKQRILKKTKLSELDLQIFVLRLFNNITVIPNLLISKRSLHRGYEVCKEIDEKDTVYIAAAIELNIDLITSDKKLYNYLQSHGFSQIVLLGDVINTLLL
ncbi:MAG: nucleotide-binding protein, PIN domain protein [Candidatus Magnetoglobus multicellularis str. Araruama]|uniref:Nucleotide-binding protein, PIN domain protein n=1 Tax=Candidatus Magnetoglobus multicellularis str. Araruama TaxID=890399 RepID=A0A1V1P0Z9_9BACT|nr:MAG: nucleotide-binding protein, PIN domain protein [Candidatus Magnetoglobus multicellularis str. Araruama]